MIDRTSDADPHPTPDVVLKWRRRGDVLEGLVAIDFGGETVETWVPALDLAPATEMPPLD